MIEPRCGRENTETALLFRQRFYKDICLITSLSSPFSSLLSLIPQHNVAGNDAALPLRALSALITRSDRLTFNNKITFVNPHQFSVTPIKLALLWQASKSHSDVNDNMHLSVSKGVTGTRTTQESYELAFTLNEGEDIGKLLLQSGLFSGLKNNSQQLPLRSNSDASNKANGMNLREQKEKNDVEQVERLNEFKSKKKHSHSKHRSRKHASKSSRRLPYQGKEIKEKNEEENNDYLEECSYPAMNSPTAEAAATVTATTATTTEPVSLTMAMTDSALTEMNNKDCDKNVDEKAGKIDERNDDGHTAVRSSDTAVEGNSEPVSKSGSVAADKNSLRDLNASESAPDEKEIPIEDVEHPPTDALHSKILSNSTIVKSASTENGDEMSERLPEQQGEKEPEGSSQQSLASKEDGKGAMEITVRKKTKKSSITRQASRMTQIIHSNDIASLAVPLKPVRAVSRTQRKMLGKEVHPEYFSFYKAEDLLLDHLGEYFSERGSGAQHGAERDKEVLATIAFVASQDELMIKMKALLVLSKALYYGAHITDRTALECSRNLQIVACVGFQERGMVFTALKQFASSCNIDAFLGDDSFVCFFVESIYEEALFAREKSLHDLLIALSVIGTQQRFVDSLEKESKKYCDSLLGLLIAATVVIPNDWRHDLINVIVRFSLRRMLFCFYCIFITFY